MEKDSEVNTSFIGWLYCPLADLGEWEADGNPVSSLHRPSTAG